MKRRSFLAALSAVPRAPILSSSLPESFGMTRHLFTASTWSYLWDLADERYAQALGRMKDNALTAVGLACAYHAGKFLAAHNPKRKVDVLEDGTVCSTPIPSQYGRIQPRINSLVGQGHSLAVVRREAERSGMETRAWVACCHMRHRIYRLYGELKFLEHEIDADPTDEQKLALRDRLEQLRSSRGTHAHTDRLREHGVHDEVAHRSRTLAPVDVDRAVGAMRERRPAVEYFRQRLASVPPAA